MWALFTFPFIYEPPFTYLMSYFGSQPTEKMKQKLSSRKAQGRLNDGLWNNCPAISKTPKYLA